MIDVEKLNSNLADVELIISSNYNFRFPDFEDGDIDESSIMISILQTRIITEGICRFIVLQEHLVKDEKSIRTATLKVYIDELLGPNLIVPKPIVTNLKTIQSISNLVVHFQVDGHISRKDGYICIESLEQVLSWFNSTYSGIVANENKWKISSDMIKNSGAIPPQNPDCIISRSDEIRNIRNLLVKEKMVLLKGDTGVGKTELIKEYAEKYKKKYDGIYYIENVQEVEDYVFNMPIRILDERVKTKQEIIEEKLDVIHTMGLTYLFILDNYTGLEQDLRCLYPDRDDEYHLLVIVNDDNNLKWDKAQLNIEPFTIEESLRIFSNHCGQNIDKNAVMALLERVQYNPRAIKMCAVFLNESDATSIQDLLDGISDISSIKVIMKNLYMILSELSILEDDSEIRWIASYLSLIPYNGISQERFCELVKGIKSTNIAKEHIEEGLNRLEDSGWIMLDSGNVSINPLLSDTLFEKLQPDLSSPEMVEFFMPILEPIKNIRDLFLGQIVALKPFVEHLTKRINSSKAVDLIVLNEVREYYIATYDVQNVKLITDIMEREFHKYNQQFKPDFVENTIFRQGISRFNLEDFAEAHSYFSRALSMLEQKKSLVEKTIAKICAYEGTSLAEIGENDCAEEVAKRSIYLREKLSQEGYEEEGKNLWISHYNYAKVLLKEHECEAAMAECEKAVQIYQKYNSEEYVKRSSTNVSSLLQLKGRIFCGLKQKNQAIELLEEAKEIREKLKGKSHFTCGQVYSYLMDAYSQFDEPDKALEYAIQYYNILLVQYKTQDILDKISVVEEKMASYKEIACNDQN